MTALVLAPVPSSIRSRIEGKLVQDGIVYYQRLGLLEVNCIKRESVMDPVDHDVIHRKDL
jgi:hypothetical protein